jgi:ferrochelatase
VSAVHASPENRSRTGVLVMAHGTPGSPEEVEPFYTRIRRGRPPSAEQLADLIRRYDAIGGISPLASHTRHQVDGLADLLHHDAPGRYLVRYGAKHTAPFIEDAAAELVAAGVGRIIGLVLTPHRAAAGSDEYHQRAREACTGAGGGSGHSDSVEYVPIEQWYAAPGFIDLVADRVAASVHDLGCHSTERAVVLFTAHSVPERTVASGASGASLDYPGQVAESAELVAEVAEVDDFAVAWQSAGRTPEPWIGPALEAVLGSLAAEKVRGVVVCPIGFVADHLEVLYDLDIEARAIAEAVGLSFTRTPSLGDEPRFLRVLADEVHAAEAAAGAAAS